MTSYFGLENREMPWGGYGSILLSGMVGHRETKRGRLQLERTGPFVPPIVDSGVNEYVLTDRLRGEIEAAPFRGFGYQPVEKARIRHVPWTDWDLAADEPPFYPDEGEPEDYILEGEHDPIMALRMGKLWSFRPERIVELEDGVLFGPDPHGAAAVGIEAYGGRVWSYFSPELARWLVEHSKGNVVIGREYPYRIVTDPSK